MTFGAFLFYVRDARVKRRATRELLEEFVNLIVTVVIDGLNELGDARRLELVKIRNLEILRVPKNLFAFAVRSRPNSEVAKEDRFGERTGVIREV